MRTEKHVVRVVIETKCGRNLWRRTILAELDLTIEERERIIADFAWLRNV